MNNKKNAVFLIIICSMILTAGVWIVIVRRTAVQPVAMQKIVLAAETVAHASPIWIAQNKGYFREEGLDVTIREFESGRTALRTMLSGDSIDMATAAQTPLISHSFDRNDYAIIAGMVHSDRDVQMLVRQDKGIHSPADLRAKKVGMTAGSSGHFFLSLLLALNRLDLSDITTVDIEATRLPGALIEGQVDAIVTWEPHIYLARKALGDKALLLPTEGLYREDFYFIARKDCIRTRHDALVRFLRAIEKGQRFISGNRTETIALVQQRLDVDKEIMDATWDGFRFRLFLDQSILVSLEDEARWAIANKLTSATAVPNYLDFIDTDALLEAKPGAVTIAGRQQGALP